MNMSKLLSACAVSAALLSTPALAGSVYLMGDSDTVVTAAVNLGDNEIFFENVLGGQNVANFSGRTFGGITTAVETNFGVATPITGAGLVGADFMIFGWSRTSVSAAELAAIVAFANAGGSLFLFGEGAGFPAVNSAVNSVLAAVGSTMSLLGTNFDQGGVAGFGPSFENIGSFTATGPETAGVNSWATAFAANIDVGSGTALISGTGDVGVFGAAVARESISAIPLPAALPLMTVVLGLLGFLGIRRRRQTA